MRRLVVPQIQKDFGKEAVIKRLLLITIALHLDKDNGQVSGSRQWVQYAINAEGKLLHLLRAKLIGAGTRDVLANELKHQVRVILKQAIK